MRRKINRALLCSVLSVILCCAMFIGSTMAWFTSAAGNKGNRIEAGEDAGDGGDAGDPTPDDGSAGE